MSEANSIIAITSTRNVSIMYCKHAPKKREWRSRGGYKGKGGKRKGIKKNYDVLCTFPNSPLKNINIVYYKHVLIKMK